MHLGEVSLSLPAIINRDGVARVLSVSLDAAERKALEASAEILKRYIAILDGSKSDVRPGGVGRSSQD
jgi:L-lactate dehydrogenase